MLNKSEHYFPVEKGTLYGEAGMIAYLGRVRSIGKSGFLAHNHARRGYM